VRNLSIRSRFYTKKLPDPPVVKGLSRPDDAVTALARLTGVLHRHATSPALDVVAILARAEAHVACGRHAAAERALRELAAALARRRLSRDAAVVLMRLGCVLSDRGRAEPALRVFEAAGTLARESLDAEVAAESGVWLASARADLRQLAEAEALCRDVRRAPGVPRSHAAWATAALARVSLWQGRIAEAHALLDDIPAQAIVDSRTAFVEGTAVRVLLAAGETFSAGNRLRRASGAAADSLDRVGRLILATARLRFLAAVGDLPGAERELGEIRGLARAARAPLREVRAGLLWVAALCRAGEDGRAARELSRLRRLGRAAPALLQAQLRQEVGVVPATASVSVGAPRVAGLAALADVCRERPGDDALAAAAGQVLKACGGRRLEVVVPAGNRPLVTAGEGSPVSTAQAAILTGAAAGPDDVAGGQELAVPIRWEDRLVAALAVRWERAPEGAAPWLAAAAAIIAAPVHACLARRKDEALCATLVPGLLGSSPAMAAVRTAVARAGPAPFAVLIHGESGVGKELVARAVHATSARHDQPMCDLNCAALPDDLLESELFGYVRGAFTGALGDRTGLFEDAHGGTLFLDEVVDLSARAQAKLLRVLQQQEVRRLGESRTRRIDVRIVSAANRDPRDAAAAGTFRLDLVYRLDVIRISVPPLRERREDIGDLAQHFWRTSAERIGSRAALGRDAVEALAAYDWPGNVRELQNVLAALAVSAPRTGRILPRHLPAHVIGQPRLDAPVRLDTARQDCERRTVLAALARTAGHRARAARELGLSRQGLLKLMVRLGIRVRDDGRGT
jgi:DNA-binding NtrC family response regulator